MIKKTLSFLLIWNGSGINMIGWNNDSIRLVILGGIMAIIGGLVMASLEK